MFMFKFAAILLCANVVNRALGASGDNGGTSCLLVAEETCTNWDDLSGLSFSEFCCQLAKSDDCVQRIVETKSCPEVVHLAHTIKELSEMCTNMGTKWSDCRSAEGSVTSEGDDGGDTGRPTTGDDESFGSVEGTVEKSSGLGGGAIAGIVIGCIVGVAVIGSIVVLKMRR